MFTLGIFGLFLFLCTFKFIPETKPLNFEKFSNSELLDSYYKVISNKTFLNFTILKFDKIKSYLERVYTSKPREYPLQGKKDVIRNFWQVQVLEKGIAFIGYNFQDIKTSFSDFDLIKKLGCSSVLIIPVKSGNNIKGSVNLLHEESWYSDNDVKGAQKLVQLISEVL